MTSTVSASAGRIETGLTEPPRYTPDDLDQLLLWAADHDVSDVTLQSGNPIFVEQFGRLGAVSHRRLSSPELTALAQALYGDNAPSQLASGQDIDCSHELRRNNGVLQRFRVNLTAIRAPRERGLEITLRTIPTTPPPLADLDLPPALIGGLIHEQGLVLITGPTGSGKTTLLASILRELLEQPASHRKILTYEAPIEYVFDTIPRAQALIAQHEIGVHLPSFAAGIRNSLRRKPMVILVGEARDAATIAAAAEAAMTGHLVYTTVHSNSVPETLRRMVSVFPGDERDGRLMDLLEALQTIVTQRLVRTTDGRRAPIREYLRFTPAMKDHLLSQPPARLVGETRQLVLEHGQPLMADVERLHTTGRIAESEYALYQRSGMVSTQR